jgi:hypothetical protein
MFCLMLSDKKMLTHILQCVTMEFYTFHKTLFLDSFLYTVLSQLFLMSDSSCSSGLQISESVDRTLSLLISKMYILAVLNKVKTVCTDGFRSMQKCHLVD